MTKKKKKPSQVLKEVREAKSKAWKAFLAPHIQEQNEAITLISNVAENSPNQVFINKLKNELVENKEPLRRDVISAARKVLRLVVSEDTPEKKQLQDWWRKESNAFGGSSSFRHLEKVRS